MGDSAKRLGATFPPTAASYESKPKLLGLLREALRSRHYSHKTEQTYCSWVKRFIRFHGMSHPAEMAEAEVNAFLSHLAANEKVSASTQNQALCALLFLYRYVIGRRLGELGEVVRARKPRRLPVVMTRDEVSAVLSQLHGEKLLRQQPYRMRTPCRPGAVAGFPIMYA
ncbi:MAG: site-specific integrase [Candidatus Margulisiibacteriota bacterium]